MGFLLTVLRYIAIAFFTSLRVLNVLEPPTSGEIPVRDYVPILSWSKITRIVGLVLIVWLTMTGQVVSWEGLLGILTYAGGEAAYRYRQATQEEFTE